LQEYGFALALAAKQVSDYFSTYKVFSGVGFIQSALKG